MSRYRPPTKPGTKVITPEGYQAMRDELDFLWKVQRPQVTQAVSEAAAQGDRSENAEYIYGKKQLREIDRRIRFLSKRLEDMVVVERAPDDTSRVYFGAWVTLENEAGDESRYRLVGPDEFDPKRRWISIDSPMAKALLRKQVDDEVQVQTPEGVRTYYVIAIHYGPGTPD